MSEQRKQLSRREVAERLGISRQRVEKLIREGRIVETPLGIDFEKAKASYLATLDPAKRAVYEEKAGGAKKRDYARTGADETKDDDTGQIMNFAQARTRKEMANADRARLDYQIKAGQFISRDEVRAKEFEIARKLRDRLLGLPSRIANFVPPDAMKIITDEVDDLIREMQDDVAKIGDTTTAA